MNELQSYLQTVQGDQVTWLGLSAVVLLWLLWSLAKKLVQIGFFVVAFAIGSGIAYGVAISTGQPVRPEAILAAGLAFAFVWNMIRAKIARVVTAVAVGTMLSLGAHQGWPIFGSKTQPRPAAEKPPAKTPAPMPNSGSKPPQKKPPQKSTGNPASAAPKPKAQKK